MENIKLAAPARRTLTSAGIISLKQLSSYTEAEIASLHGIGKTALEELKKAMAALGLTFKQV